MITKDKALSRLDQLTKRAEAMIDHHAPMIVFGRETYGEAGALLVAVRSLTDLVFEGPSPYKKEVSEISLWSGTNDSNENKMEIARVISILVNIKEEIEQGLLASIAGEIQAGIFDDFLDHSEHYLSEERKNEASVIAGVTFEDTIRRLCSKHSIEEKGRKLNLLIDELAKQNILSSLEAKRARVGADIRTKATHAQWKEVDESAVRELISFLRSNLILKLGA